jgi:hypothetical protein
VAVTALSGSPAASNRPLQVDAAVAPKTPRLLLIGSFIVLAAFEAFLSFRLIWELGASVFGRAGPSPHYDFLAFYSAAHFVLLGKAAGAYNSSAVAAFQHLFVPQPVGAMGYMPFLNPPFAAVLQAPLALLSEPVARIVWFAANALLAIVVVRWLTTAMSGKARVLTSLALIGSFPVYQTLIEGQWSLVMLAGCLLGYCLASRGRQMEAGLGLSVLWLKPQLAILVILGLLLFRCWRPVVGMVAALLLLALVTLPFAGAHTYVVYVQYLTAVSQDHFGAAGALQPAAWRGAISRSEGLNGMFAAWFGEYALGANALYALSVAVTLLVYVRAALHVRPGIGNISSEMMLLASIGVALLIDPHLYPQDVVLLLLCVPILVHRIANPMAALMVICLLVDSTALDLVVPLHLYTVTLWSLTVLLCLSSSSRLPSFPRPRPRPLEPFAVSDTITIAR